MLGDPGPTGDTGKIFLFIIRYSIEYFKMHFLIIKGPTGDKGVIGDNGPTGDIGMICPFF